MGGTYPTASLTAAAAEKRQHSETVGVTFHRCCLCLQLRHFFQSSCGERVPEIGSEYARSKKTE